MPLKRARYIHHQGESFNTYLKGFSAQISPSHNDGMVNYRLVFCSDKDQFCRRKAREELEMKPWQEVRVVDLPRLLATAARDVHYSPRQVKQYFGNEGVERYYMNLWAWVYKYFL